MSKERDNAFEWPIIGHRGAVSYLQHCLSTDHLHHAYLFVGPRQCGKSTMAWLMARSLVCQRRTEKNAKVPCGECQACIQSANRTHPDIYALDREVNEKTESLKKNISIEQVRQLQGKLSLHTFFNSYKVAIIDQAESLSIEAANALLKTLEEPTPKTVIILMATHRAALPTTVLSRCQVINFLPVGVADIVAGLRRAEIDPKKAKMCAALSFGRPGLALDYARQPETMVAVSESGKIFLAILKSDLVTRFKLINQQIEGGADAVKERLLEWTKVTRDLLLVKVSANSLVSHQMLLSDLSTTAELFNESTLVKLLRRLDEARRLIDANSNVRLLLEQLVLTF